MYLALTPTWSEEIKFWSGARQKQHQQQQQTVNKALDFQSSIKVKFVTRAHYKFLKTLSFYPYLIQITVCILLLLKTV